MFNVQSSMFHSLYLFDIDGTLVDSPPNGIAAAKLGIGFMDWLKFGVPAVLILMPLPPAS